MLQLCKDHALEKDLIDILFQCIPGGVSIATDASCREIIHNPIAAAFLRIPTWGNLSYLSVEPPPIKVFSNGVELKAQQMPMITAATYGEVIVNEELEFVWPDGVAKIAKWNAKPIKDSNGIIIGVISTMEDITSRKQIEEELRASEERYRSLFENSLDAILLTSPSGKIHYVNPATCAMFQWTKEELFEIGRQGIIDASDPNLATIINERDAYGKTRHELTMVRKDGTSLNTLGYPPCQRRVFLLSYILNIKHY